MTRGTERNDARYRCSVHIWSKVLERYLDRLSAGYGAAQLDWQIRRAMAEKKTLPICAALLIS